MGVLISYSSRTEGSKSQDLIRRVEEMQKTECIVLKSLQCQRKFPDGGRGDPENVDGDICLLRLRILDPNSLKLPGWQRLQRSASPSQGIML